MLRAACTASQAPARETSCVASVIRSAPSAMWPLESSFFVPVMRSSMDRELEAPAHIGGRRNDHERAVRREGALRRARDLLADDAAHRATHELEVHDDELDGVAADRGAARDRGVTLAALRLRRGDALRIRLGVDEAEW